MQVEAAQAKKADRQARAMNDDRVRRLERDMGRWEGLGLVHGRAHKLHLPRARPALAGPIGDFAELGLLTVRGGGEGGGGGWEG